MPETPSKNPTARKVLGKMASDAAVGAITGAAQAVMPEAAKGGTKGPKKSAKTGRK